MEIAVEATMSQKCVKRNMMQAPPKSKKEIKGYRWCHRRGLDVFRISWGRHTREARGSRNVGFPVYKRRCNAPHLLLRVLGGAGRKVGAGFANLDSVYKMARFVWGTSR